MLVLALWLAAGSAGQRLDRIAGHVHCGENGSRYRGWWDRDFRAFGAPRIAVWSCGISTGMDER